jgi:sulfatase maturation enzyme AslB (radical SAM superfamily)
MKKIFITISFLLFLVFVWGLLPQKVVYDVWGYEPFLYKEVITDSSRSFVYKEFEIKYFPPSEDEPCEDGKWVLYANGKTNKNWYTYNSTHHNKYGMILYVRGQYSGY